MVTPADILNGRILVVDDQELTARGVAEMLRDAGYGCVTFTTNPRLQAPGDHPEQGVPDAVPQRVVDLLETVQVQVHDRH